MQCTNAKVKPVVITALPHRHARALFIKLKEAVIKRSLSDRFASQSSEVNDQMMWSVAVLLFLSCAYARIRGQQSSAGSCELQHCTPSTESLSAPFTNEEDAILDARCLLACVEEVRLHAAVS